MQIYDLFILLPKYMIYYKLTTLKIYNKKKCINLSSQLVKIYDTYIDGNQCVESVSISYKK